MLVGILKEFSQWFLLVCTSAEKQLETEEKVLEFFRDRIGWN